MAEQLVTIATYSTPLQGHLAKGLLQANGIAAVVLDEHVARMTGPHSGYIEGVRLQVRESDARDAVELLGVPDGIDPLPASPDETPQTNICPLCGSPKPGAWAVLSAQFHALFTSSTDGRQQICSGCGVLRRY